jgi:serine/threonine-protein kinase
LAATLGPERFHREIKIAAKLSHPHILAVHDSGDAEGFLYYVMPYVEGESLRERMQRVGPLPIEESLAATGIMIAAGCGDVALEVNSAGTAGSGSRDAQGEAP